MTTIDAKPFQTLPPDIAALPTGSFILPATVPAVAPANCVADSTKSMIWGCQIQPFLDYEISISIAPEEDVLSNSEINLEFKKEANSFLPYGAQPPVLKKPKSMRLVNDSQNPERGPAWFFQASYDKIVILPESVLTPPGGLKKRTNQQRRGNGQSRSSSPTDSFKARKGLTQPGEKPWFCYWNGTLLETFIYVNQTSWAGFKSLPSPSSPLPFPTSTLAFSVPTPSRSPSPYTKLGALFYPKLVKMEERRVPMGDKHVDPYCVQHIAIPDGTYQPILDATGKPTTLFLDELEPLTQSTVQVVSDDLAKVKPRGALGARDDTECSCLWLVQ